MPISVKYGRKISNLSVIPYFDQAGRHNTRTLVNENPVPDYEMSVRLASADLAPGGTRANYQSPANLHGAGRIQHR